ncbi:alpha/beta hydrolase [Streptomyces platensis]|uniref:alpha/beta hydrolase n=1 Tax=Streptomyces platensis TaxID=58346 RepID=UPI002E0ECA36|nr:alpha/beta hydrolase [Streptomyces platensis]
MRSRRMFALLAGGTMATVAAGLYPVTVSAAPPLEDYLHQKPAWKRCYPTAPANFQCAKVKVPLDYRRPDGKKIELAISRIKAQDHGQRHGVLLMNPGGPGGDDDHATPLEWHEQLPKSVRDRFDLVGFDPRGQGKSAPVHCGLTKDEDTGKRPYRPGTFDRDVAWARSVADKCRARQGDKLSHITTRNTARDMDVIRAVLGEKKISYLGVSYGTYLGAVYTQMFPGRADRFVLDSAVDPNRVWRGMETVKSPDYERAFTRWSKWTAQRAALYHLGDTPAKVRKTFWDLVARANRTPIKVDGEMLTGDDLRTSSNMFFIVRKGAERVVQWKKAAKGTTANQAPPASNPKSPTPPSPSADSTTTDSSNDHMPGFWSIVCSDTRTWPRDPAQYRHDAARDKARYPLYGDIAANITPCAFWSKGSEPATTVNNTASALILHNEWDPATSLASGLGLHQAMKGSRMVKVAGGEGHGVYGEPHPSCAKQAATTYLTTGRLPANDMTCRASSNPPR